MAVFHKGNGSLNKKARRYLLWSVVFCFMPIFYGVYLVQQGELVAGLAPGYRYLPLLLVGFSFYYWRKAKTFRAGAKGENQVGKYLKKHLPRQYHILSNCQIDDRDCQDEIDLVIVGETGIFVVEVKNHNGLIRGSEAETTWRQEKIGRGGKHYQNKMKNPIRQTNRHAHSIAQYLRKADVHQWVEGILVFSNPKVTVYVESTRTMVFNSQEAVVDCVLAYEPQRGKMEKEEICRVVELLQAIC